MQARGPYHSVEPIAPNQSYGVQEYCLRYSGTRAQSMFCFVWKCCLFSDNSGVELYQVDVAVERLQRCGHLHQSLFL